MMKIFMENCQRVILEECGNLSITRDSLAISYRLALEAEKTGREKINWNLVNTAIIERWSRAGLKYIKEKAWKGNFA